MEAVVTQEQEVRCIHLQGKIDMANAGECENLLEKNMTGVETLVIDLSKLSFIDSTGIGSLVTAIRCAYNRGIGFKIINVPEGIDEVFQIVGVYELPGLIRE